MLSNGNSNLICKSAFALVVLLLLTGWSFGAESIFDDDWSPPPQKSQPGGSPPAAQNSPPDSGPATPAPRSEVALPALQRLSMPTKAKLAAAGKQVAADYLADYSTTEPKEKIASIDRLVQASEETGIEPARRYVLLRDAATMAASIGDLRRANQAADRLGQVFTTNPDEFKLSLLTTASGRPIAPNDQHPIAAAALVLADRMMTGDAFDAAARAAGLADASAAKSNDAALISQVKGKSGQVQRIQSAYAALAPSLAALKADQQNADANLAVGRFYCFTVGNWEKGLAYLRTGSDAELKVLAEREKATPRDAMERIRLADGWWEWAHSQNGQIADAAKLRAADYYRDAQDGSTGPSLVKIQKRLAEVEPKVPTINLLRLAKISRDKISGDWIAKNGVIISGVALTSRMQFPYAPPREYDYRVEVTVVKGTGVVTQILPKARSVASSASTAEARGESFVWGAFNSTVSLDGFANADTRIVRHLRDPIHPGDRLTMLVKVRATGVKTYINGVLAIDLKTDFNDAASSQTWQLHDARCLGIGASGTNVIFNKVEVREVSGPGTQVE